MSKKRVLVWETLATVSGGQKMTLTVLDMLSDQYEFCCLIPKEGILSEELNRRNIPYVVMGDQTLPTGVKGKQVVLQYGWMSAKNICKSLMVIRKYKPDLLYCPGPAALPWSAICGSITHKPVIWHLHHIFLDGATKKLLNTCGKWRSVKRIIAVSNCVGNQIKNHDAHSKVVVLYNPVDVEKYANGNPENVRAEIESALGRKIFGGGGYKVITQIAAITKNKRQDVFVHAIAELRKTGEKVIGLFLGDVVTDSDREYKRELIARIRLLHLEDSIYVAGFRNNISDYLALTDCVLIPSEEGLSLAAMEAMSAKCHVIAQSQGGAHELLMAAGCGTFYQSSSDVSVIARAVRRSLSENEEKRNDGFRFCLEQSPEVYGKKLHHIFELK